MGHSAGGRHVGRQVVSVALLSVTFAMAFPLPMRAEEAGAVPPSPVQETLNPLADVIKLPATLSFGLGFGPDRDTQPTLTLQPVIPFGLTEDWRIVSRSSLSIIHLADPDETTGLGDLDVSLFLTPARTGPWVWGLGPIFEFPTATDTTLGTGKWSAGPAGTLVYVSGPWIDGILVSQLWSFAGADGRQSVSLTQIEALLSYAFANNWYVQTNPTFSCDWQASSGEKWVVPIGIDIGKVFPIGSQSVSLQLGGYYNVKKPDGAADWVLQVQIEWDL